jgi:hypothetical protein
MNHNFNSDRHAPFSTDLLHITTSYVRHQLTLSLSIAFIHLPSLEVEIQKIVKMRPNPTLTPQSLVLDRPGRVCTALRDGRVVYMYVYRQLSRIC